MRKDIINITNRLAQGQGLDFDIMGTYKNIFDYCKRHKARPTKQHYKIINGGLYINNNYICRVAPLPKKLAFDNAAYYAEGRILARQENYTY